MFRANLLDMVIILLRKFIILARMYHTYANRYYQNGVEITGESIEMIY